MKIVSVFVLALCHVFAAAQASSPGGEASTAAQIRDEPISVPAVIYPQEAREARIEGVVQLQVNVDATGHVTSVNALSGPTMLRQAAIDAYSKAVYPPLVTNGRPGPAIVTAAVRFDLKELPPDTDQTVDKAFEPLHAQCQQESLERAPGALEVCRRAVQVGARFSPGAQLEVRATALNDLVLLLIADGKRSKNLGEAGVLADQAVELVSGSGHSLPHTQAVAIAYITRAEVRSLAGNLKGAGEDCGQAEEVLQTLLADQAKDVKDNDKAGNLRVQLRDTLLLHAVVLDRDHKGKQAQALRDRAALL